MWVSFRQTSQIFEDSQRRRCSFISLCQRSPPPAVTCLLLFFLFVFSSYFSGGLSFISPKPHTPSTSVLSLSSYHLLSGAGRDKLYPPCSLLCTSLLSPSSSPSSSAAIVTIRVSLWAQQEIQTCWKNTIKQPHRGRFLICWRFR